MRVIVAIKQVPETNAVRMDDQTGTMIRDGVEAIVNPLDIYAVEAALSLCESRPDQNSETVAISMGPAKAMTAIREVIAMGIDRGVLISDKAFAGSDTWATSYVLGAGVRWIGDFDLIVCGERATDGDTGQVGPGIAAWLDLPVVTYVSRIDRVADGIARVHRLVENGYEVLDVQLPAVLTVVKEIAYPRLPTLRGKQRAREANIPALKPGDLDVERDRIGLNGSPTRVVKIFRPRVTRHCELVHATDEHALADAVDRLVAFLEKKDLI